MSDSECEACQGNVAPGKYCYACGLKGPAGQGLSMNIKDIQLKWHRSLDGERSTPEKPWHYEIVTFKNGHTIYLQDDGDGEFSLVFCDKENDAYQIRTGFKSSEHAKIWLEENDAEKLRDLSPDINNLLNEA